MPIAGELLVGGIECTVNGFIIFSDIKSHAIYAAHPYTGEAMILAGAGAAEPSHNAAGFCEAPFIEARFNQPISIALCQVNECLYISDQKNHRIRHMRLHPRMFGRSEVEPVALAVAVAASADVDKSASK